MTDDENEGRERQARLHVSTHTKQNSWWLNDAKGIPLSRVCDECINAVKSRYAPEVLGRGPGRYEEVVEERIEPDE